MSSDFLEDRRSALEESFFAQKNQELLDKLRAQIADEGRKDALSACSGIQDDNVLERLVGMDINPESLSALTLVPLVAVGWADGTLDDKERAAVLSAAEEAGLKQSGPCHDLLRTWLDERPPAQLLETWKQYVQALAETMDATATGALRDDVIGRARGVAEAAGGILGLTSKISASEQRMLDELSEAFS